MTGIKLVLLSAIVGLAGIIQSDHIDSWAKLTAIPILGLTIGALLWFNNKNNIRTLETHERVCDGIRCEIKEIGKESKDHQDRVLDLMTRCLNDKK